MADLLILIFTVSLTAIFYFWSRSSEPQTRLGALIFTFLYCVSLGLALRFGGRTYPGLYFPHSPVLNGLLNGNGLFVELGYWAVNAAFVADILRIVVKPSHNGFRIGLIGVKWLGVGLAFAIALYGFAWAAALQRFP